LDRVPLQTLLLGLIDRTAHELGSVVAPDLPRQSASLLQLFQYGHHAHPTLIVSSISKSSAFGNYKVGKGPVGVVFDGANIWVSNNASNNVTKLHARNGALLGTFPTGGTSPGGTAFDGVNIWVTNTVSNTVSKM
jgi:DNA-binding beta-propeller fold protein YncE